MGVHSRGSQPQLCQRLQNSRRSRSPWIPGRHHSFQLNKSTTLSRACSINVLLRSCSFQHGIFPEHLAEPPFEPLDQASLLDLPRKTTFLVAAACGRRVLETHALSTAERHLVFRASAVHLLPRAGFLAKNQTVDFSSSTCTAQNHTEGK